MTIKMQAVTIPERIEQREVGLICDLCGAETGSSTTWATDAYSVAGVTIEYESGSHYPEGRDTRIVVVDLCPACFTDRLLPWLREHDVTPYERRVCTY